LFFAISKGPGQPVYPNVIRLYIDILQICLLNSPKIDNGQAIKWKLDKAILEIQMVKKRDFN
jgi:hypothetical protein